MDRREIALWRPTAVSLQQTSPICLCVDGEVFIGYIEIVLVGSLSPTYLAFVLAELTVEEPF